MPVPFSRAFSARPGSAGATTLTATPCALSADASRSKKLPGRSPSKRGKLCVRKRTFIWLAAFARLALRQLIQAPAYFAKLGALPGSLFSQEARGEEHTTQHQTGLNHRPHRANADARRKEHDHRADSGERADGEERRPQHAEQEQRLLSEPQLEPHGQHVEHADRDAPPARELGFPGM